MHHAELNNTASCDRRPSAGDAANSERPRPQAPLATHLSGEADRSALRPPVEPGQYTSHDYALLAGDLHVQLSVGRTGQCWDNALAESFFASLKGECLDQQSWPTRAAARREIVDYIAWFNGTRLHSSLGYLSPDEYEASKQHKDLPQVA